MKLWTKCDVMQDRNQWRTVDSIAIHSPFAYHKGEESFEQLRGSYFPKDCVPQNSKINCSTSTYVFAMRRSFLKLRYSFQF
jgi:hypothetical protein